VRGETERVLNGRRQVLSASGIAYTARKHSLNCMHAHPHARPRACIQCIDAARSMCPLHASRMPCIAAQHTATATHARVHSLQLASIHDTHTHTHTHIHAALLTYRTTFLPGRVQI
jgi:hypothetical protein